jgi:lipopolysaccharide/colanic/teichoic acid biosynthesis glycosyltransferase
MIKRTFDLLFAVAGLIVLSPILVLAAVMVKLDSRGPVFFRQERIGKEFSPFHIYKFRTMSRKGSVDGPLVTVKGDPRITRVGRILRKTKIDELPQLINVLIGEMSFVGPRPEVRQYVELFRKDYVEILKIRPGITDLASLKYRDEESVLRQWENPDQAYVSQILPDKIRLAKEYIRQSSLCFDLGLIFKTLLRVVCREGATGF